MVFSVWETFDLISLFFCLQVRVRGFWGELGSERDRSVSLHPPGRHPGLPYGQPGKPMFLQRPKDHQELQSGRSPGHQLLSRWSVCISFCWSSNIMTPRENLLLLLFWSFCSAAWYFWIVWTGRPIFISLPHFLYGSPYLRDGVKGLNPIKEDHYTFLDVEPVRAFDLLGLFSGRNSDADDYFYFCWHFFF